MATIPLELSALVDKARGVGMNAQQREEQRRSFAFGNTNIENAVITKEIVRQAAERLEKE